jgi:hypothetical protein
MRRSDLGPCRPTTTIDARDRRRWWMAFGCAAGLALLIIVSFGGRTDEKPAATAVSRATSTDPSKSSKSASSKPLSKASRASESGAAARDRAAEIGDDTAFAAMSTYQEMAATYPPHSLPITAKRAEAFRYNRRTPQALPVSGTERGAEPRFYSVFTADKQNVFENETITITLKASRTASADGAGLPIRIDDSGLSKGRRSDSPKLLSLDLRDDGQGADRTAGDFVYTAAVNPSKLKGLVQHHGSVRAFVEYSNDGTSFGQQLFFEYFPEQGIAARFTGKFREAVEDGSLVVYAELNVAKPGHYALDANLLARDGSAFCHSRFKGKLEPGLREARFLFFGKAIRDATPPPEAPFRVTELYGQMVPEPQELQKLAEQSEFAPAAVPLYQGEYTTAQYDVNEFSDAAWQGAKSDPSR